VNFSRLSRRVIIGISAITAFAIFLAVQLTFDYNFENFFPPDDPETEFFFDFRQNFRSDNDFVIVAIGNDEGVFQRDFLLKFDSLAHDLSELDDVDSLLCPTWLEEQIGTFGKRPILNLEEGHDLLQDSSRIFKMQGLVGTFFSRDGQSLAITLKHTEYLSKPECDTLATNITATLDKYEFDHEHAVGRSIGQDVYIQLMKEEMVIFMALSAMLIIIFLLIAFRSSWGIWVPIMVVILAIIWILGLVKGIGNEIDLMLTVLPTIIFVVGMSDVVHILTKYFEELRKGKGKLDAIKVAFREIGIATFLTSLTTAIGFLTLLTTSIKPIANFGVYIAIGVFMAYILSFTLLPAVLILRPMPKVDPHSSGAAFWSKVLHRAMRWTIRHKALILVVALGVCIASGLGISKLQVNNYMLEDLTEDHFLKKEFAYLDEQFSGARPFEAAIVFDPEADFFSRDFLDPMSKLDEYLITEYGVGALFSPSILVKQANVAVNNGRLEEFKIPDNDKELAKLVKKLKSYDQQGFMSLVLEQDSGFARFSGKTPDAGRQIYDAKNLELYSFIEQELSDAPFEIKVTGTAHLIDHNNNQLSSQMILGLSIAFIIIGIIVGFMFKSLRMVVITFIPNILPLLMVAAVMGYMGIYLKVSTSIIFTIAFGIAVDDTIHFISKFRLELGKGKSKLYALKRTYISTGKAIIVTTCILCGGFLTLLFSSFMGTFYIGLLVGLTLILAVISDLFLLPVLIILFYKRDHLRKRS
jgi:predicted RND superfamily exporter protein